MCVYVGYVMDIGMACCSQSQIKNSHRRISGRGREKNREGMKEGEVKKKR